MSWFACRSSRKHPHTEWWRTPRGREPRRLQVCLVWRWLLSHIPERWNKSWCGNVLNWNPYWPGQLWSCRGEKRGGWPGRWGVSPVSAAGNKYPGSRHTLNKFIVTKMTYPSYFIFSPDFSVSWLGRISKAFPFIIFILVMEVSVNSGARNKTDSYDSL